LGLLLVLVIYCFGNVFVALWSDHWNDPQYSHGYLVPLLAAVLLWMRWDPSVLQPFQDVATSHRWWGLGLLMLGLSLRLVATHFGMEVPDMFALIPCLAGVLLLAGGWRLFVWAGPVVVFLVFMFPLPWRVARLLLNPLQKLATAGSTYLLQAAGYGALREGNVIHIAGVPMEVIDACSGLRMLTVFLALCGAVALIIERPLWERALVFFSAVPIALAVNIVRITATGMAHYHIGGPWIKHVFHDQAGLFMMPVAIVLLFLEITLLNHLFVDESERAAVDPVVPARRLQGSRRAREENIGYRVVPTRR
jgi:exosortase